MPLLQHSTAATEERAFDTLPRADKGPLAPPPTLDAPMRTVAEIVAGWPGVSASMHWHFSRPTEVDGVDFYVGEQELGHLHLDGAIHLATSPTLGRALIAARLARPFRYARGWVEQDVTTVGVAAATALFRANYDRLTQPPPTP